MRSIGPLFGVVQHLESWTQQSRSPDAQALQRAWALLYRRRHHFDSRPVPQHSPSLISTQATSNTSPETDSGFIDWAQLARQIIVQAMTDQFDEPPFPGVGELNLAQLVDTAEFQRHFQFHQQLLGAKLALAAARLLSTSRLTCDPRLAFPKKDISHPLHPRTSEHADLAQVHWAHQETRIYLHSELRRVGLDTDAVQIVFLDAETYPRYRQRIAEIQAVVYEPARQTSVEKFDALMNADHQMAIVIEREFELIAMIFAAPLANFPDERGVTDDPEFQNPQTFYVLDLTVLEAYRGGLGRVLKQAVTLYAACLGIEAIHGRNRDRYARGMWAINLSLGSIPTRFLIDDYPDDLPHRDCIYYRCPVIWANDDQHFSGGAASPLRLIDLIDDWQNHASPSAIGPWMSEALPSLVANSTFDQPMHTQVEQQLQMWFDSSAFEWAAANATQDLTPVWLAELRRLRPTGQRLIGWHFDSHPNLVSPPSTSGRPVEWVSFLGSRSQPDWDALQSYLDDPRTLAFWYEPLTSTEFDRLSHEHLAELLRRCHSAHVPTVAHESTAAWFRYDQNLLLPSQTAALRPTISLFQLAPGFAAAVRFSEFAGQANSMASFNTSALIESNTAPRQFAWLAISHLWQKIAAHSEAWRQHWQTYDRALRRLFDQHAIDKFDLNHGIGWFEANDHMPWLSAFDRSPHGRYLSCPAWGDVRCFDFLAEWTTL